MEKSLKECLNEAANLIETSGWCRGAYVKNGTDGKLHFCFIGAIEHVCRNTALNLRCGVDNHIMARRMGFTDIGYIFHFNDKVAKRKGTVIKKMREIAAGLPDEDTAPVNCA